MVKTLYIQLSSLLIKIPHNPLVDSVARSFDLGSHVKASSSCASAWPQPRGALCGPACPARLEQQTEPQALLRRLQFATWCCSKAQDVVFLQHRTTQYNDKLVRS